MSAISKAIHLDETINLDFDLPNPVELSLGKQELKVLLWALEDLYDDEEQKSLSRDLPVPHWKQHMVTEKMMTIANIHNKLIAQAKSLEN